MYIDLTNKSQDTLYSFELNEEGDNSLFEGRNIEFISQINLKGSYKLVKERVDVKADILYTVKAKCDKCLKTVERDYKIPIEESFHKDSQDPEEYGYNDHKVELGEMVKEKILLNLDQKILCKDNCKGICPICGSDLNINECSCKTKDEKNPFAILKSIVGGAKNGSTKK